VSIDFARQSGIERRGRERVESKAALEAKRGSDMRSTPEAK
jgi:hypothetical protein